MVNPVLIFIIALVSLVCFICVMIGELVAGVIIAVGAVYFLLSGGDDK